MKFNPVTIALILIFIYPIAKGFLYKFSSQNLKADIQGVSSNISFLAALILGIFIVKRIFLQHDSGIFKNIYQAIPSSIINYFENNTLLIYIIIIPLLVFIVYMLIYTIFNFVSRLLIYPLVDVFERFIRNRSDIIKRVSGAVIQLPKAVCYVLFVTFILNTLTMFNMGPKLNKYLETSAPYNYLCKEVVIPITNSKLARQLPSIIDNSFKVVVKEGNEVGSSQGTASNKRVIVYYNGVTLDEGVRSNSKIDNFARQLVSNDTTSKGKAKTLYTWVGSNIAYDQQKANMVLNNDFDIKSGAIPTFDTRKGICFDYASLYVAMARATGLKVRLVTGEGFNGVSWVGHAWNQVYIPEEDKWINVDPTFYRGGNYFNSRRFDLDHRDGNVAGEW